MKAGIVALDGTKMKAHAALSSKEVVASQETVRYHYRSHKTERAVEEPFGPPPKKYKYRCPECGTELLVNEAVVDAEIGMAKFNKEYYEGYMPKVGCPWCNNYTIERVEKSPHKALSSYRF